MISNPKSDPCLCPSYGDNFWGKWKHYNRTSPKTILEHKMASIRTCTALTVGFKSYNELCWFASCKKSIWKSIRNVRRFFWYFLFKIQFRLVTHCAELWTHTLSPASSYSNCMITLTFLSPLINLEAFIVDLDLRNLPRLIVSSQHNYLALIMKSKRENYTPPPNFWCHL